MDWYGDNNRSTAAWLRELIREGHLPQGEVDERCVKEVKAADLAGYRQCHFFAGIGGWPLALRLAGWPADRPIWTASCPCQPFSAAGKRKGEADQRHLWPVFFRLIRECRPATCFGEQVASSDGYRWLSRVRADLEAEGYGVGYADLPAASQGAPHKRSRLFWVAYLQGDGREQGGAVKARRGKRARKEGAGERPSDDCEHTGLSNSDGGLTGDGDLPRGREHGQQPGDGGIAERMDNSAGQRIIDGLSSVPCGDRPENGVPRSSGSRPGSLEHPNGERLGAGAGAGAVAVPESFWSGATPIRCKDGKWRRVPWSPESGVQPLVDGLPVDLGRMWVDGNGIHPLAEKGIKGRVGLLRGAGNAIVPQVAAAFIKAFLEAEREL
ncbi:MAG: DNA cytosine methyltransferase [Patescibacteria group bacterium]|nr:DNA cytosine methyltransferase [Patescibacteria group bacterium]